jgi:hypothetical protein
LYLVNKQHLFSFFIIVIVIIIIVCHCSAIANPTKLTEHFDMVEKKIVQVADHGALIKS